MRADMGLFEDLQYMTGAALQTRLDQYQAIGAKWARFQLIWSNVQSGGPDSYDWQPYDELIAGLVARGIQPLVVIDTTPSWARPADCESQPTCAPADPAQYAQFAADAVARYQSEVHDWEIWNEPNNQVFWQPFPNVGAYTALLKLTYAAIKGVDPGAEVITGGTAPEETTLGAEGETLSISPVNFLAGIYREGGGGSFDAVGAHPYTFPELPGAANPQSAWAQLYATTTSLRSLMVAHGDGAKRIWGTEFGAHTDPQGQGYVDEAEQAAILTRAYKLWSSYSWAGPLIWFSYQDSGANLESREEFFGLTQADGAPKPAYFAFKELAEAGGAASGM
jgi:polysaccharide biosynthesis protein PslG